MQRELQVKTNLRFGFGWEGVLTFSHNSPELLNSLSHKLGGHEITIKCSRRNLIFVKMPTFLAIDVMRVLYFRRMRRIDLEPRFVFHDSAALPVYNYINRESRKCQNIPHLSSNLALVTALIGTDMLLPTNRIQMGPIFI